MIIKVSQTASNVRQSYDIEGENFYYTADAGSFSRLQSITLSGKDMTVKGVYTLSKWVNCIPFRYHRLTRANKPAAATFRRFLSFSPWRALARLRLKNQKSLENALAAGAKQFCRSRNVLRQGKARREYCSYFQAS
ncbi:MAG: hypothetical protein DBY18_04600 [Clostridia bacterium]|nr:MAG: hypothetical protein DBY18_04600 [Clostridia bacterium]